MSRDERDADSVDVLDVTALLDPQIAKIMSNGPLLVPVTASNLTSNRDEVAQMGGMYQRTGGVVSEDVTLSAVDGFEFSVRVHTPIGRDELSPAVIWLHGGGLVSGSYTLEDWRFDRWTSRFGVVGVAVDYGLAPERPYPGPLDDCYAALKWVHEQADELGVARDGIGIGGASAGGNLCAALSLLARDRGEYAIAFQALVYPMLDDRMVTNSSYWDVPIWPRVSNDFGWNAYLQGRRGEDDIPIYAAPARATDLSALPPTFMAVGALDGFVDEDLDYARRLMHAGVPIELHVYPGAPHGFDLLMAQTDVAGRARSDLDGWLVRSLG